jgi:hypothetical protein
MLLVLFIAGSYTTAFAQSEKEQYVQQWIDSLNSRNSDVWIALTALQRVQVLKLSKDSIDLCFTKFSEHLLKMEQDVLVVKQENSARRKFYETVFKPAIDKFKTQEEYDNLVHLYPEFFGLEDRARLSITEEMVARKKREHINWILSQESKK